MERCKCRMENKMERWTLMTTFGDTYKRFRYLKVKLNRYMRWHDLDRVIDNHGYLGDFPWIRYICSALGGSSVKFAGFSIGFIQLCSFLMSLNESRSGEMRMDFITFVSWVLTAMLISTIISTKIDVYVGMFTVRIGFLFFHHWRSSCCRLCACVRVASEIIN